jgi:hypothetical protein
MDVKLNYCRIGKKVNGVFMELDSPAFDGTILFDSKKDHKLTIAAVGDAFVAYLDGVKILNGQDSSATLTGKGRVGFYSWGNPTAQFLNISIREL